MQKRKFIAMTDPSTERRQNNQVKPKQYIHIGEKILSNTYNNLTATLDKRTR